MKKNLFLFLCLLVALTARGKDYLENLEFRYLQSRDGLSNSEINSVFKDNNGFLWFGTQAGLDRFDGFRFKNFFYDEQNTTTLMNNSVNEIQQDITGDIWLHTPMGYCIYNYQMERFDREPVNWMQTVGMRGTPERVFIDSKKNMWFAIYGKGIYYLDMKTMKPYFFQASDRQKNCIPSGHINRISESNGTVLLSYNNGTLCRLDGKRRKIVWVNNYLSQYNNKSYEGYLTYTDSESNIWVVSDTRSFVYSPTRNKWYEDASYFLREHGIDISSNRILIHDIKSDRAGNMWIATDHDGLYIVNLKTNKLYHYLYDPVKKYGLSDNTVLSIYIDDDQSVWLGTLKNGIAYYSPSTSKFQTIDVGDICTITEDANGILWMGSNDEGIVAYNPVTGERKVYDMKQTGLGSNVVVSSCVARDGSLYFGTYNGGMVRYKNGQWKVFRAENKPGGLANDNVWSLKENRLGEIVIATLGSGVQVLDPKTDLFVTYNIQNSALANNYTASLELTPDGDVLVGTSVYYSIMEIATRKFTTYKTTKDNRPFYSPSVNHAFMDSRGIVWCATASGISMYDPVSDQMELVNELNGTRGAVGCALMEDNNHEIWAVSDHFISHIRVNKDSEGKWQLTIMNFNALDGLQDRQFNYRAICLTHKGDIVVGGQDGINIIHPQQLRSQRRNVRALFSGLILFDHPISANEEYNGRVVLEESLEHSRRLVLEHNENSFTIQLASSKVEIPARSRFLYRMDGVSEKWMMTAEGQPSVSFNNLSSGTYKLQVKVVDGDGTVNDEVSEMEIVIRPPFYLSIWAIIIYLILIGAGIYYYRERMKKMQKMQMEKEQATADAKRIRELNELKLNFFTNISHELRTPLTLILSPIREMLKKEDDNVKRQKLSLIQRNAERLLTLVNQILDFRKIESKEEELNVVEGDIVGFIKNVCTSFKQLANQKITLSFFSAESSTIMLFDADKISKVFGNLLSNAYKFTPDGGKIDVEMHILKKDQSGYPEDMMEISVADTGKGISDEDKQRIFDRFYQVDATKMQPFGGSGIGLSLVKKYVEMHNGAIVVKDREIGGTNFVIDLPIRRKPVAVEEEKPMEQTSMLKEAKEDKEDENIVLDKSRHTLLLVDDSEDFREFMVSILAEHYNVIEADNGKSALEKIKRQKPDVILSDVMMPIMDGNEFCRAVKENPSTASIPFIMLTARLTQEQKIEGFESGADEYITKPFSLDLLNLRIANLIKWASGSKGGNEVAADKNVTSVQKGSSNDNEDAREGLSSEEKDELQMQDQRAEVQLTEGDKRLLLKIDRIIEDNMSDPDLNVEKMSREIGMSRVQLYKRMVPITGNTPSEYIRAKRIERAEQYLRQGDRNVSEIAFLVGFNNPRYFSKYFSDVYGMTPSQYKKTHMM